MKSIVLSVAISTVIFLSGCQKPTSDHRSMTEVGRFAFYPSSGEMPAILLDTATGCVEQFVKLTNANNIKDVTWARRYLQISMPTSSMSGYMVDTENTGDFKSGRLPIGTIFNRADIAPPLRCKSIENTKK